MPLQDRLLVIIITRPGEMKPVTHTTVAVKKEEKPAAVVKTEDLENPTKDSPSVLVTPAGSEQISAPQSVQDSTVQLPAAAQVPASEPPSS